ncbi:regulatory protein RecX [Pectinatus cerevisiiphilus]|uniref:Regulatory protein RecX n=1 Tax=Pectinatus cerevisiiphilus TaxID=86956 RepID=A0A4V6NYW2_9FIRM|nr:regulatory protein RecX [Pectinatus cerevisiiphilus]TCS79252.1 regulatory protein [Pectinatus cerevisiiphilus]
MRLKSNKSALAKAVDYLAVQDYSVKQIRDKLLRRGYQPSEITAAIDKLIEKKYLDDEQLCRRYWQMYLTEGKCSIRQIKAKLVVKGFASAIIDRYVPQDWDDYERTTVCSIWQKNKKKNIDSVKFMQYLYRKGFSMSSIHYAADKFANDELI